MTIAVDQNLGSVANDAALTSLALTTSATAASSTFITAFVTWFTAGSVTLSNITGGGLTWTIDKQGIPTGGGAVAIVSAQAPSGLASGTVLTANFSAATGGGVQVAATSWTGVATSSPVDGTPPAVTVAGAGTGWTTANYTIGNAGSVLVGLAFEFASGFTSTPTSPAVEIQDWSSGATNSSATAAYKLPAATGSFAVAGTWSGSAGTSGGQVAVAYLPGASAAGIPDLIMAPPHR